MSSTADAHRRIEPTVLDEEAFAALYARHRAALGRYVAAKTRSREQTEDLVQEVFAKAFARRERFDPSRPFWPWLASIAARECIDAHRRRTRAENRAEALEQRARVEPVVDDTSTTVLRAMERHRLARAVDRLPDRQRAALQLVALEEWSYADVAQHLGYSIPTVKALLARARHRLREAGTWSLGTVPDAARTLRRRWQQVADRMQAWASVVSSPQGFLGVVSTPPGASVVAALVAVVALSTTSVATPTVGATAIALPTALTAPAETRHQGEGSGSATRPTRAAAGPERAADEVWASANPAVFFDDPRSVVVDSFELSPRYEEDHTVFLVGDSGLRTPLLAGPVLVSHDGGSSWTRLPALGLGSVARLLLPPAYPADNRIFALTAKGLQVSYDDGRSFETLVALPTVQLTLPEDFLRTAVVSPAFHADDPSILMVVGGSLWRYRADRARLEAVPLGAALVGHEVTGVAYATDGAGHDLLVTTEAGAPPVGEGRLPYLSRCSVVAGVGGGPELRCATDRMGAALNFGVLSHVRPVGSGGVYAPFQLGLLVSQDGGRSFRGATPTWPGSDAYTTFLRDIAEVPGTDGRSAVAALSSTRHVDGTFLPGPALARTDDAGGTWAPITVPGFHGAQRVVVTPTGRIIAAGRASGIACSEDGGRTWATLCPTPDGVRED